MGTWSDMFVSELIERIARAEAQVKALQSRLEKVKKPTLYTGAFYATVQLPEKCPDCDARYWISCGPKSMICGVCAAMQAADEAEEQVAALKEQVRVLKQNAEDLRDSVLNQRGSLAENGMTNDQVNDVLAEIDDAFFAQSAAPGKEREDGKH